MKDPPAPFTLMEAFLRLGSRWRMLLANLTRLFVSLPVFGIWFDRLSAGLSREAWRMECEADRVRARCPFPVTKQARVTPTKITDK